MALRMIHFIHFDKLGENCPSYISLSFLFYFLVDIGLFSSCSAVLVNFLFLFS